MEFDRSEDCKQRTCISVNDLMKKGQELAAKHREGDASKVDGSKSVVGAAPAKDCPVDKDELGRSTWNLLHSVSVYYPEKPSDAEKAAAQQLLEGVAKTYPCEYCAKDLRKDLVEIPPKLGSRNEFAQWMCDLHNRVNEKTGKPVFDCSKVFERWRDGWKDGRCDLRTMSPSPSSSSAAKERWNESADAYLAAPPMRRKLRTKSSGALVPSIIHDHRSKKQARSGSGGSDQQEKVTKALFASFLDMLCDQVPDEERRATVRTELCSHLVELRLVPAQLFADELSPLRRSFSQLIQQAIAQVFISNGVGGLAGQAASNVAAAAAAAAGAAGAPPNLERPLSLQSFGWAGGASQPSRFHADFDVLEEIGRGGFGVVYKAKSRVDGCMYAVKMIRFKRNVPSLSFRVLSEVSVLASLTHPNVVRYHCGWVELEAGSPVMLSPSGEGGSPLSIIELFDDEDEGETGRESGSTSGVDGTEETGETDEEETSEEEACTSTEVSLMSASALGVTVKKTPRPGGKFWGSSSAASTTAASESGEVEQRVEERGEAGKSRARAGGSPSSGGDRVSSDRGQVVARRRRLRSESGCSIRPVIFIQMELCTMTLEQYLSQRNAELKKLDTRHSFVDGSLNRSVMEQLISALAHLHARGVVHRDVKPSNVFLRWRKDGVRAMLGDFGLACVVETEQREKEQEGRGDATPSRVVAVRGRRLSRGVGTATYAAPEQLHSSHYGPAVDIFSCGVVLLEVYSVWGTGMERGRAIDALRTHRMVDDMVAKQWPTVARLVLEMTDPCPTNRPAAPQLLKRNVQSESSNVTALREIVANQNREIALLREALMQMKREKESE